MILRSIFTLVISFLILWPAAARCQGYEMFKLEELAGLRWGISSGVIKQTTKFSLQGRVSDSQYIETGKFDAYPCQYAFTFFENGLQSVVVTMKLSKEEILKVKERFIRLNGMPTIYDPDKNAYQWKENSQEATIVIFSAPTSTMMIGLRKIEAVPSGSKYDPCKLSSLQGVHLGITISELQKMPYLQPLVKVSDQVYKTHTFFNSRPSTATFVFRNGILKAIGLDFSIENASRSEIMKLFSEYKEFLTSKYGTPTYENPSIPSIAWKEGYFNTLFRWLEKDSSFVLFFKEDK
jgi:hypothetical protein